MRSIVSSLYVPFEHFQVIARVRVFWQSVFISFYSLHNPLLPSLASRSALQNRPSYRTLGGMNHHSSLALPPDFLPGISQCPVDLPHSGQSFFPLWICALTIKTLPQWRHLKAALFPSQSSSCPRLNGSSSLVGIKFPPIINKTPPLFQEMGFQILQATTSLPSKVFGELKSELILTEWERMSITLSGRQSAP